ncbi:hypothetical protein RQP46_001007 [Phenoliferia psychrophenolica]
MAFQEKSAYQGADIQRTVSLSPEQFEKLFLTAGAKPTGDARHRFGNPAPLGLISFAFSSTTACMVLMGFHGSNPLALVALTGMSYYIGFFGMALGGIFEFIQGNTFPMVVFLTYAGFWGSFAVISDPRYDMGVAAASPHGPGVPAFYSAIGLFLCVWALLSTSYALLGLRTNVVFVGIQVMLTATFSTLAAAYFAEADGRAAHAGVLFKAGGACLFVVISFAWYLFIAQLVDILQFNFELPVGDLSHFMARKPRVMPSSHQSESE